MQVDLPILYEDEALLAVNKPAGIHCAPAGPDDQTPTVLELALASRPELSAVTGFHPWEPALLHRLDFGTSGLLLFAKTTSVFEKMRYEFSANNTCKTYLALCQELGTNALPPDYSSYFMRAGPGGCKVKAVNKSGDKSHGRKCTTDLYRSTFAADTRKHGFIQVKVQIHRGFRHQIRCHLATAGFPIVGDNLYNPEPLPDWAQRLYLHAWALDFPHPLTNRPLHIVTPRPWSFADLVP